MEGIGLGLGKPQAISGDVDTRSHTPLAIPRRRRRRVPSDPPSSSGTDPAKKTPPADERGGEGEERTGNGTVVHHPPIGFRSRNLPKNDRSPVFSHRTSPHP
jgi:hypothetical protein